MYSALKTLRYWTVSGETEIVKGLREEVGRGGANNRWMQAYQQKTNPFYCFSYQVCGFCATVAWTFNKKDNIHITTLHMQWHDAAMQGFQGDIVGSELQRGPEQGT